MPANLTPALGCSSLKNLVYAPDYGSLCFRVILTVVVSIARAGALLALQNQTTAFQASHGPAKFVQYVRHVNLWCIIWFLVLIGQALRASGEGCSAPVWILGGVLQFKRKRFELTPCQSFS